MAATSSAARTTFPFSGLVGQEDLRRALLVNAVSPDVGGVLVRGERGTAKSTAVRALEALLPPIEVVVGCPYGSAPQEAARCPCEACAALLRSGGDDGGRTAMRAAPLVELPVGATVDRVLGTLDLERALREGEAAFEPGLLARAHRGILYVDEVNLLADHLVDVLLDAAAQGEAVVEREGVSVRHPARFLLVGTMNPEEGELRPQLLDRFGLAVTVVGAREPATRAEVVRRRLAFEADPAAFAARFAPEDARTGAEIAAARERLPDVRLAEPMLALITGACARLHVDGMRADLVAARAARTVAALAGRTEVAEEDVRGALELALPHRRRRGPLDPPGLEEGELDEALRDAAQDEVPEPPEDDPDGDGRPDGGGPDGGGPDEAPDDGRGGGEARTGAADGERRDQTASRDPSNAQDPAGHGAHAPGDDGAAPEGARTEPGAGTDAGPREQAPPDGTDADGERPFSPTAPAPSERTERPAEAARAAALPELAGHGTGVAGRRGRAVGVGPVVDARRSEDGDADLALVATLRAAAQRRARTLAPVPGAAPGLGGRPDLVDAASRTDRPAAAASRPGLAVAREDHRTAQRAGREGTLVVFCVDASGSMGARRRMAAVKDVALGLLMDAYQRRDRIALVTFRGPGAQVVLPPTGSVERAAERLRELPTGGGTPLAAGLEATAGLVRSARHRDPGRRVQCLVVTDGRASNGEPGLAAAERAATALGREADGVVVFDSEQGRVRLGLSARVAAAAGARVLPLQALTGEAEEDGPWAGRSRRAGGGRREAA